MVFGVGGFLRWMFSIPEQELLLCMVLLHLLSGLLACRMWLITAWAPIMIGLSERAEVKLAASTWSPKHPIKYDQTLEGLVHDPSG